MSLELVQFSIHHQLLPCPRVVQSTVQPNAILWMCVLMLAVRCATCHGLIGDWSRRFIFSRSMPRVIFWLVMSFQMPNSTTYKQQSYSPTLHISEIFFLDICRLAPRLKVFSRLQSPFNQIQVFSSSSSLGFKFSSKCLKLLFSRLLRPQTSTMIQLVTVLVVVVIVLAVAREHYGRGIHIRHPRGSIRGPSRIAQDEGSFWVPSWHLDECSSTPFR